MLEETTKKPRQGGVRVNKEYVTRAELVLSLEKLDRKMAEGFTDLTTAITELKHSIEESIRTAEKAYDARYLLKEESMADALQRMNDPVFQRACFGVAHAYLCSEDGKEKISSMIVKHMECQRDNMGKWINFVKIIGGIIVSGLMIYGGTSVYKTQLQNTAHIKTLIEHPQQKTGD
ncbi:MAG TPA: hypothetical protein PL124_03110 [Candidatus Cloacimonadota bacterium]|nr:hypothetical protein [Candidatus Cloacimonadota bacterium]HPS38382.1 hypothetical protein [Candidatus Cloacimonadota bacterium]